MPVKITPLLLAAGSLAASALLLALSLALVPPAGEAAYAVLSLDESAADRETAEALGAAVKGKVLSESSQWVFLDDFGELRQIPLDEYGMRLEPFDPRNDGYADRVRSFFVRDGKRFFFIPLNRNLRGKSQGELKKDISAALGSVFAPVPAWSLERQPGRGGPRGLYLALFAAASVAGLFLLRPRSLGAALFPSLGGLCLRGAPGFALAAILCLLGALLAEPVRELGYSLGGRSGPRPRGGELRSRLFRDSVAPHRFRWGLSFVLLALYGLAAVAGQVPPALSALTFLCFGVIFFFFFAAKVRWERAGEHIRFVPVPIMARGALESLSEGDGAALPKIILPFALASCLALLVSVFWGGFPGLSSAGSFFARLGDRFGLEQGGPAVSYPPPISAAEYQAHGKYQKNFSVMPLGRFDEAAYFHYDIGKDGLIDPVGLPQGLPGAESDGAIPPFPLESLMDFLTASASAEGIRGMGLFECAPVLLVLLLSIPALGGRGRKKKGFLIYSDKRIAA